MSLETILAWTTEAALDVGQASAAAAALIVFVLLMKRLIGCRLTPRWRYALGCVMLARLLWPAPLQSRWSILNWGLLRATAATAVIADERHLAGEEMIVSAPTAAASDIAWEMDDSELPPAIAPPAMASAGPVLEVVESREPEVNSLAAPPRPAPSGTAMQRMTAIAPALWLAVCGILLVHAGVSHVRFARRVRRRARPVSASAAKSLDECKTVLGVRRRVALFELDGLSSPAVFGFLRPRVLLPCGLAQGLSRDELRHVLLHELAHVRSIDVFWNWAIITARALHWFNPLAWLALRQFVADREVLRDAAALRALESGVTGDVTARRAYGHTLLKLAASLSQPRLSPGLVPLIHTEKEIHRRIIMIKTPLPKSARWLVNALGMGGLASLIALTFTIATAQADKPKELPPSPVPPVAPRSPAATTDPAVAAPAAAATEPAKPAPPPAIAIAAEPPATPAPSTVSPPGAPVSGQQRVEKIERRPGADEARVERRESIANRQQRLEQMEKKLAEIDEEMAKVKALSEKDGSPQYGQNIEALSRVRAELTNEFYRMKYLQELPAAAPGAGGGRAGMAGSVQGPPPTPYPPRPGRSAVGLPPPRTPGAAPSPDTQPVPAPPQLPQPPPYTQQAFPQLPQPPPYNTQQAFPQLPGPARSDREIGELRQQANEMRQAIDEMRRTIQDMGEAIKRLNARPAGGGASGGAASVGAGGPAVRGRDNFSTGKIELRRADLKKQLVELESALAKDGLEEGARARLGEQLDRVRKELSDAQNEPGAPAPERGR